jgi:hypothetical protein
MKIVYDAETDEALRRATDAVTAALPEVADIIDRARSGQLTEDQAVAELTTLVAVGGRDLHLRLQDIVVPPPGDRGLPRLDPTYESRLSEHVQFDGDIPQLRFGPMPRGATPAVPVDTDARDPAAIGIMLGDAASQVSDEAARLESDVARQLADAVESGDWSGIIPHLPEDVRVKLLPAPGEVTRVEDLPIDVLRRDLVPDPAGYERGRVPALRTVAEPTGAALATMSAEDRGAAAWRFLSTSQGRRSATRTIAAMVEAHMRGDGLDVTASHGVPDHRVEVLAHAEWSVGLSGPNGTQPGFAFVDTAARALATRLGRDLAPGAYTLEVATVDTVDVRRVGWAARLVRR